MPKLSTTPLSPPDDPPWAVEMLLDHRGGGRHHAYTWGLSGHGLPELYVGPFPVGPRRSRTSVFEEDQEDLVRRAQWLVLLGRELLAGRAAPSYVIEHGDESFRFWPGAPEPPAGMLAVALPDAAEVVPVLWERSEEEPGDRRLEAPA